MQLRKATLPRRRAKVSAFAVMLSTLPAVWTLVRFRTCGRPLEVIGYARICRRPQGKFEAPQISSRIRRLHKRVYGAWTRPRWMCSRHFSITVACYSHRSTWTSRTPLSMMKLHSAKGAGVPVRISLRAVDDFSPPAIALRAGKARRGAAALRCLYTRAGKSSIFRLPSNASLCKITPALPSRFLTELEERSPQKPSQRQNPAAQERRTEAGVGISVHA